MESPGKQSEKELISDRALDDDDFEKCVLCGARTTVLKTTPIQERNYYIEGVGQLCESCAIELQ
jgi:hypothetical protein